MTSLVLSPTLIGRPAKNDWQAEASREGPGTTSAERCIARMQRPATCRRSELR
jgi:hypothetical protein